MTDAQTFLIGHKSIIKVHIGRTSKISSTQCLNTVPTVYYSLKG